jgi:thioesterase domain-containing protein
MGGTVALEMAQQLCKQGHKAGLVACFETYNWIHRPRRPKWSKIYTQVQRLEFHLRNFLLLDRAGKQQFLHEKIKVLRDRIGVWYGAILSKLGRGTRESGGQNALVARLWAINERAPFYYDPGVYPGRITNFLPKGEYAMNKGPGLHWEGVASGGVETHVQPAYPAGMMVEPFVEHLAEELNECISKALEAENIDKEL